ncbi:maltoporin [Klebsiella pneumoniae]
MNTVKKLPLAMAVVAALCPISVMAQEFTQEQIDAIVAKAVDKALADRQAKIDAAANKKVDVITNPETTAASPDMAIPFGSSSASAPAGAHFQTGDQKYVGVDGSYNGARRSVSLGQRKQRRRIPDQQGLQKRAGGYLGSQRDVRPLERRS